LSCHYGRQQRFNHEYRATKEILSEALIHVRAAHQDHAAVELLIQLARVEAQQGSLRQAVVSRRFCSRAFPMAN